MTGGCGWVGGEGCWARGEGAGSAVANGVSGKGAGQAGQGRAGQGIEATAHSVAYHLAWAGLWMGWIVPLLPQQWCAFIPGPSPVTAACPPWLISPGPPHPCPPQAVGVRLTDGRVYRGRTVVSNATRWDTFERLVGEERLPPSEVLFRGRYTKAPSFLSIHMGVRADVLPPGTDCHHIVVEDWAKMEVGGWVGGARRCAGAPFLLTHC